MTDYVAYYRVSTDRQGASGLGLDAQRQAVARHVTGGQLAAAFTEIESGRRDTNRPQLHAALAECRKRRAVLLIVRLDRLARNVAFIANLMESGVDFVAVDMPTANRLTIHILAAVAEHEREMISARTKAALAQAKARGTPLGNPRPLAALKRANAARAHLKPAPHVLDLMAGWKAQGKGLREIARELNRLNIRTPRSAPWYACTVRAQLCILNGSSCPKADATKLHAELPGYRFLSGGDQLQPRRQMEGAHQQVHWDHSG
jgi:DNA invertase Pin-like site-specific DNA recombinase